MSGLTRDRRAELVARDKTLNRERGQNKIFFLIQLTISRIDNHASRYFQHAHFISIVGVGKRGAY